MTTTILPEKMEIYKRTARLRERQQEEAAAQRREAAWGVVRQAAAVLKERFGAKRVIAFGSLAHGAWFSARSDIDLMVEGIAPEKFWQAWCALDPISSGFEIELVAAEEATDRLREIVDREGVAL